VTVGSPHRQARGVDHRTTVTGTDDRRTTVSATLPKSTRETPSRPWLPTMTWSISWSAAYSTMARAGEP
jgi:hypothetical protein